MFGHQDNQPTGNSDQATTSSDAQDDMSAAIADLAPGSQSGQAADSPHPPPVTTGQAWHHPGDVLDDSVNEGDDVISPAGGYPKPVSSREQPLAPVPPTPPALSNHPPVSKPSSSATDSQLTDATNEELIEVKQKALDQLFPLIDKLDQTPEEHFKTLMMIIQASDNQTLIEKAYQIAQTIDNEKSRAQALLDIINEINYFTQQPEV